jgi:predicted nucleic acid-binding protein
MEKKTQERLERKWLSKPMHLIDTSVMLELLTPRSAEDRRHCERYISRIGKVYRGSVSTLILGEFAEAALRTSNPELPLGFLPNFINRLKVSVLPLGQQTIQLAQTLKAKETRLEHYDSLHLATADHEGCSAFVTIDEKIIRNPQLERLLKLKIVHPKELI